MISLYGKKIKLIDVKNDSDKVIRTYLDQTALEIAEKDKRIIKIMDKPVTRNNCVIKVVNEIKVSKDLGVLLKAEPLLVTKEAYIEMLQHAFNRSWIRDNYGRTNDNAFWNIIKNDNHKLYDDLAQNPTEEISVSILHKKNKAYVLIFDKIMQRIIGFARLAGTDTEILSFDVFIDFMLNTKHIISKNALFFIPQNYIIQNILGNVGISNSQIIVENDPILHEITSFVENKVRWQKTAVINTVLPSLRFIINEKRHKTVVEVVPTYNYGL